ncbi:thiamine-monophosphate kinase [Methanoculleus taiwanensis]|uniref:Thiamine-monophosphate kinase n=1 Tax=Methanoculleus taiwanensis TaxID=1550565 RepID=A0A498H553_9EURY|nr:thiamine-phosphate kinase [Methanoculleus taiwanensis]RXE57138.1 thiamine-monophosphate kinase [Methanoculleus taiwanensis]
MDDRDLLTRVQAVIGHAQTLDDCAVLPHGGEYLVATTDMLHETTDFPCGMTGWQIGWMSVAVTLSDIAAMGASPTAVLLAVGLDDPERLLSIMEGANDCCTTYGAELAGGDLDAHRELTIVSTGLGHVAPEHLVRRKGARPGDVVAITGTLGEAQAALEGYGQHRQALLEPQPRLREGIALGRAGATAMMDISDGLALSLYDMVAANGCGFAIDTDRLPLPAGVPEGEARELALHGGGDFELLFTCPKELLPVPDVEATIIGRVTAEPVVLASGRVLERRGYQHRW